MAKRIVELDNISNKTTSGVEFKTHGDNKSSAFFVAVDRIPGDDGQTGKVTIKSLIGSVIGGNIQGVPRQSGGDSLEWVQSSEQSGNSNYYLRLSSKVNIPATSSELEPGLGGRISLWMQDFENDHSRAMIDVINTSQYTNTSGIPLHRNEDWFRVILTASNAGPYYTGLAIHRQTGNIYKSESPNNPNQLVPIGGDAAFDATALHNKDNDLQTQINALKPAGCHVGETPLDGASDGSLWWDTNTAKLYIWVETSWVEASPGGGGGSDRNRRGGTTGVPTVCEPAVKSFTTYGPYTSHVFWMRATWQSGSTWLIEYHGKLNSSGDENIGDVIFKVPDVLDATNAPYPAPYTQDTHSIFHIDGGDSGLIRTSGSENVERGAILYTFQQSTAVIQGEATGDGYATSWDGDGAPGYANNHREIIIPETGIC